MDITAAIAYGILGVVFAISGWSKLARPSATAMAIVRFGLSPRARVGHAWLLGGAELALAASLLLVGAWATIPVFVVLCLFSVLIASALVRGQSFSCACFGSSDRPISGWTLARNVVLIAVAVLLWVTADTVVVDLDSRLLGLLVAAAMASCLSILVALHETDPFGPAFQTSAPPSAPGD